jgi:SRSO17 transposase
MEARYTARQNQWLQACQVAPEIFHEVMPRLHTLMKPFVATWHRQARHHQARTSVSGLRSDVERHNVASIADRLGQDRLPLQRGIGWAPGDEAPLRTALCGQVAQHLGQHDGVLGFDPSAFPTSGMASVGVARQWCGRLGQVDHGPVARYVGYVSGQGHTLVDMRLDLPTEGTPEKGRLAQAGVPHEHRGYRTRHPWALAMLAHQGTALPHGWMAGEDARGRSRGVAAALGGVRRTLCAGCACEHAGA